MAQQDIRTVLEGTRQLRPGAAVRYRSPRRSRKQEEAGDQPPSNEDVLTDLPPVAAFQLPPFLFRARSPASGALPADKEEEGAAHPRPTSSGSDGGRRCGGLLVRLKRPDAVQPPPTSPTPSTTTQPHGSHTTDSYGDDKEVRSHSDAPQGRVRNTSRVLESEARHLRVLRQHVAHHSFFRQHEAADRAKSDLAEGQHRLFALWDSLASTPGKFLEGEAVVAEKENVKKGEEIGRQPREAPPPSGGRAQVGSFSFAFALPSTPAAAGPPRRKAAAHKRPARARREDEGATKRKRRRTTTRATTSGDSSAPSD